MALSFPCPHCGENLKAQESHVGRKAKCTYCQQVFVVPEIKPAAKAPEVSPGGSTVYRHQPASEEFQPPVTYAESCEQISDHVERYIGPIEMVWHELISDRIHLDVLWVKPTPERNFHTYITSGMSDMPMTTPPSAHEYRYAELVLCLPPDWPDIKQGDDAYWPIYWLKSLARLPHMYNTWLHSSHTIPNGDPPEPFDASSDFCCWLIIPPLLADEEFRELEISPLKKIHFFGITPLYQEEMDFKLTQGFDALIDRWDETQAEINELLNLRRPNSCG